MSKLVKGKIPKGTPCPFDKECKMSADGDCYHRGVDHKNDFSCGLARGFDLLERIKNDKT